MGRKSDYLSSGKTIAASAISTFSSSDIPGAGVIAYHLSWTGANTLANIDRFRVKANGVTIYDITPTQLRAYVQNATGGQVRYPAANIQSSLGAATPVNWRRVSIPFLILDRDLAPSSEMQDVCQFPTGSQPTLEVVWGSGAGAGTLLCGWTETDVDPRCFPRFYGTPMNIAAGATVGKHTFTEDGQIRGLTIEQTGLARLKVVLSGEQLLNASAQPVDSASVTEDSMLLEMMQLFGEPTPSVTAGTAAVDNSLEDVRYIQMGKALPAINGRSFVELATTTAWSGVASELGVHSIVPY